MHEANRWHRLQDIYGEVYYIEVSSCDPDRLPWLAASAGRTCCNARGASSARAAPPPLQSATPTRSRTSGNMNPRNMSIALCMHVRTSGFRHSRPQGAESDTRPLSTERTLRARSATCSVCGARQGYRGVSLVDYLHARCTYHA